MPIVEVYTDMKVVVGDIATLLHYCNKERKVVGGREIDIVTASAS